MRAMTGNLIDNFKKGQNYIFLLWCLILPWSLAAMQIVLVLLTFSAIIIGILERRSPIKYHPFYLFILLYFLAHFLTLMTVDNFKSSLTAVIDNDWVLLTLPFIVSIPMKSEWRRRGIQILLFSTVITGFYAIIQFFLGVDYIRDRNLSQLGQFYRSVGGYESFFALAGNQLFAFGYAFSFFLLTHKQDRIKKIYLIVSVIILLSIIGSMTRSAWLGLILVLLLATLVVNKKYFIIVTALLLITGTILFLFLPDLQSRFLSIFDPSKNEARLNLWHTSWKIFLLLGIGHVNFDHYFEIYKVPGFYDAKGHAHNDYLNLLVLNGIIGLITWLGMWISWFYYSVKTYCKAQLLEVDKMILLSGILGVSGILVGSAFQCYYTDLENNIFWWFVAMMNLQIIIQYGKK
jgi:O-antigen ligase